MTKENFYNSTNNGRWNKSVELSDWHFDLTSENKDYWEACTFQGTGWDKLVEKFDSLCWETSWAKKNPDQTDIQSEGKSESFKIEYGGRQSNFDAVDFEMHNDLLHHNCKPSHGTFSRYPAEDQPEFKRIAEHLGLVDYDIWFQTQKPGHMFHLHVDKFGKKGRELILEGKHRSIIRFMVALDDWKLGQVFQIGNSYWKWKAGQCVTWSWKDIPHGTANFGWWNRPMLQITGTTTDRTYELLDSGNFDNIVKV